MENIAQKITPSLWFDNQAEEAAVFYTSIFRNSKISKVNHYTNAGQEIHGQQEGQVMTVEFELTGKEITALNGGPVFKFTPALSFFVNCKSPEETKGLWEKLSDEGSILMPFQKYPFSDLYGWAQDKYGLSWQVMFTPDSEKEQNITPTLLFVGDQAGNAEEAMLFYTSLFNNARIGTISRYGKNQEPDKEGTINYAAFTLEGQNFNAMDSNHPHDFTFNEAASLIVNCKDQQEIDYYWEKLSADPAAEQCGWLKDKYGLSWQIVPVVLNQMISNGDKEKSGRAMNAMLKMKKLDIEGLKQAYEGK